jgi:hypothetical protein
VCVCVCVCLWVVSALVRLHPCCGGHKSTLVQSWTARTGVLIQLCSKWIHRASQAHFQHPPNFYQFFHEHCGVQWRGGSELLVEAGDQRRSVVLPTAMRGKVSGAKFQENCLVVTVKPRWASSCWLVVRKIVESFKVLTTKYMPLQLHSFNWRSILLLPTVVVLHSCQSKSISIGKRNSIHCLKVRISLQSDKTQFWDSLWKWKIIAFYFQSCQEVLFVGVAAKNLAVFQNAWWKIKLSYNKRSGGSCNSCFGFEVSCFVLEWFCGLWRVPFCLPVVYLYCFWLLSFRLEILSAGVLLHSCCIIEHICSFDSGSLLCFQEWTQAWSVVNRSDEHSRVSILCNHSLKIFAFASECVGSRL